MYSAPIVKRVIEIIKLIVQEHRQFGVTHISTTLSINKSTVFGVLRALQAEGFVVKDPVTKRYTMGPGLFELSTMILKRTDLATLARPFLEKLSEHVGETVILGARENNHLKFLEVIEAKKDLKISSQVGARIPITAGATGKVVLSFMEDDEIASLLKDRGLPQFTEKSITDTSLFLGEIAKVRRLGYALDFDEYLKGTMAVAAPVRAGKRLIGVVWVVGFTSAMDDARVTEIAGQLTTTTRAISRVIQSEIVPIYSDEIGEMMKVLIGPGKKGKE